MSRKDDPDFIKLIKERVKLDPETGLLSFNKLYAQMSFTITFKGEKIVTTYAHLVWLLSRGAWPTKGTHVDHINDNPQDNRPENLQELTEEDSHKKRRGRMVYRTYGTGKYGYGMYLHHDKRDNRYYITRHLSRGHGEGDLKAIRQGLGGFDTLEEAETKIAEYIEQIKVQGLDWMPPPPKDIKVKRRTIEIDAQTTELRRLRQEGYTIQQINEITGITHIAIYNRVKDLGVDKRRDKVGSANSQSKLTDDKIREIRKLRAEGRTFKSIGDQFGVSDSLISAIIVGKAWSHVIDDCKPKRVKPKLED